MKTYKVIIFLGEIDADDEDSLKDAIKEAMAIALEKDDNGEEDIDFDAEELES